MRRALLAWRILRARPQSRLGVLLLAYYGRRRFGVVASWRAAGDLLRMDEPSRG